MADDQKINNLDKKIDSIVDKLHTIDLTLERNTQSLEYHVKRTNLLEEHVMKLENDLKPVKAHVLRIDGGVRLVKFSALLLSIIGTLAGIIFGVFKLFSS